MNCYRNCHKSSILFLRILWLKLTKCEPNVIVFVVTRILCILLSSSSWYSFQIYICIYSVKARFYIYFFRVAIPCDIRNDIWSFVVAHINRLIQIPISRIVFSFLSLENMNWYLFICLPEFNSIWFLMSQVIIDGNPCGIEKLKQISSFWLHNNLLW
jgi:hypothetical protein